MKLKLLPKMMISLAILGIVLTCSLAYFSYYNTQSYLEEMYSYQVVFGAKSIAKMLNLDDVRTIISEGGDKTEAYERTRRLMNQLKQEGEISYLSLVTNDEDSVTFYIDSNVPEMGDRKSVV